MRNLLAWASAALALAACNVSHQGQNGNILFTPRDCGNPLLSCDFAHAIATGGTLNVQITGQDGFSTAGVDLVSNDPELTITKVADIDAKPAWQLRGNSAGVAQISAQQNGSEVDYTSVTIKDATRLGLTKIAGNAVGPTDEAGYDEAWAVNAGQLVSFQALPFNGSSQLMGKLGYTVSLPPGSHLLDTETSSSDRPNGYLYVQPAAGDYPFTFLVDGASASVAAVIHAR